MQNQNKPCTCEADQFMSLIVTDFEVHSFSIVSNTENPQAAGLVHKFKRQFVCGECGIVYIDPEEKTAKEWGTHYLSKGKV